MRRGLERYAPQVGYDMGALARQKLAQTVTQKAGLLPGDWVLDVDTGSGILGVQVARRFTRAKVVLTSPFAEDLAHAAANARAEGCHDRVRPVRCLPDLLPFKDETFYFTTLAPTLAREEEPVAVLDEAHRATAFAAKVYAAAVDFRKARDPPEGAAAWVFDDATVSEMRQMGFAKIQTMRIALLSDGAQVALVMAKRDDPPDGEPEDEPEA